MKRERLSMWSLKRVFLFNVLVLLSIFVLILVFVPSLTRVTNH